MCHFVPKKKTKMKEMLKDRSFDVPVQCVFRQRATLSFYVTCASNARPFGWFLVNKNGSRFHPERSSDPGKYIAGSAVPGITVLYEAMQKI